MHGLGNDFAIFDARSQKIDFTPEQIRALADRKRGIGWDQLIVLSAPKSDKSDIYMKIYNIDGSEAEGCGNATRCVASILMKEFKKTKIVIETIVDFLVCAADGDKVRVDMGAVKSEWNQIPLSLSEDTLSVNLELET